ATPATLKILMSQPWKGNVRELDNAIEHALILGEGEWITADALPRSMRGPGATEPAPPDVGDDLRDALRSYERVHVENVLRRTEGDKRLAAERLGLSLSSLYRKIEDLGIRLD
ncbi:MAG: helix-turn-helix domain-containing protein, partial [Alphaproteobacteria bacterium]